MDINAFTLLVVLSQLSVTHSAHVSGTIAEDTTFFYRKLPVVPSVRATIEFSVSYSQSSMRGELPWPLMGIYTAYPKINIDKCCSYIRYGQFQNENLHPILRVGRYRTTTCELSGTDTVNCSGRVTAQNYIPRNFHLTFGFDCHLLPIHSLQGLKYNDSSMNSLKSLRYNITFSNQSNETNDCVDYSTQVKTKACNGFYRYASLPNLFGHEQLDIMREYSTAIQVYEVSTLSHGMCHKHLLEILCHVMLPECDPVTQQVIHPCRETCWALLDACWQAWLSLAANLLPKYGRILDDPTEINCTYLPSVHGSIPFFYKPVTCGPPPDVTNGTMMVNATQKDVYQLHEVVHYTCINDIFEMRGADSITCLYSGQWSQSPPKCFPVSLA